MNSLSMSCIPQNSQPFVLRSSVSYCLNKCIQGLIIKLWGRWEWYLKIKIIFSCVRFTRMSMLNLVSVVLIVTEIYAVTQTIMTKLAQILILIMNLDTLWNLTNTSISACLHFHQPRNKVNKNILVFKEVQGSKFL